MKSQRFFVTGTDTGVGKTEVSAALLSLMRKRGLRPFAFKPCESGEGNDSKMLWKAAGAWQEPRTVCLYRMRAPLAPMLAARAEQTHVDWKRLCLGLRTLGKGPGVVEGAGGLFVPLDEKHDVIDFIAVSRLPVILVARAGLGTLNHTVLSLAALRDRRIPVAGVVLSQSVKTGDVSVQLNRPELVRRFPKIPFFGPVSFEPRPTARRERFERELAPLL